MYQPMDHDGTRTLKRGGSRLFILCTGHQQRKGNVRKFEEQEHENVEIFQQI